MKYFLNYLFQACLYFIISSIIWLFAYISSPYRFVLVSILICLLYIVIALFKLLNKTK